MGDVSRRRGMLQGGTTARQARSSTPMIPLGEMFGYASPT